MWPTRTHTRARNADNLLWRHHVSPLSAIDVVDDPGMGRSAPAAVSAPARSNRRIMWLWAPEFADGCYLGPYSTRRRHLSSITRAPRRKVMGVPGQRSHAARKVVSATW